MNILICDDTKADADKLSGLIAGSEHKILD